MIDLASSLCQNNDLNYVVVDLAYQPRFSLLQDISRNIVFPLLHGDCNHYPHFLGEIQIVATEPRSFANRGYSSNNKALCKTF